MTTIKVEEATGPDDLGLGNVPVVPVFVDSSGRRSRRIRRVGWVVSAACLAYIGLIAVSMSDTQIGPLISIPPVAQSVVEFPDNDAGPPGALEVPQPASSPTPARAGTATAVPRTTTTLAAMSGHSTKKVGSKTAQTAPPTRPGRREGPDPDCGNPRDAAAGAHLDDGSREHRAVIPHFLRRRTRPLQPFSTHRRRVRPKWVLIALVVAMFCSALLLDGLVRSQIGIDARGAGPDGDDSHVPVAISAGGPVLDLTQGRQQSLSMPPKRVALTFDDGPDATWTPQVLAVLAKYHVPATFFVIGSSVARHPDLVRQIRAEGSEIGIHTFTHPDLAEVSPSRVDREMTETQLALAGATGELSYLVRPPYSSEPSALDDQRFGIVSRLGTQGYVTALVDVDSLDWERPGAAAVAHNAVPEDGKGGVVLLHDAGGDRSQTVEALDQLIPEMQADGFTFTTVSTGVGLPPANFPAGPLDLALGRIMLVSVAIADDLVSALEWSLLLVGGTVVLRCLLVMLVAIRHGRRHRRSRNGAGGGVESRVSEPVSVVVPAFNEKECIAQTVRSLVASTHPVEIIVVDDGSTDGTAEIVEQLGYADVRVIRQPNSGKPAALNTGIAAASHDIVALMDGDTVFEPGTVAALVQPFADPSIGAVAGNARVADRARLLSRLQHIEYVIGFNIDRRVQDSWGVVTTVPGAIGAFRTRALRAVGGVSADTLAEDTDLAITLGRAGWRTVFEPTARAWTEAPATLGQLWRQRYRWSYGIMQSLWKHRRAIVERGPSGHVGRVGLALTALFQIVLPLLAPMVDIYLVYGLLFLDPVVTAVTWGGVLAVQLTLGAIAFRLEGEPLRALWLLPAQQFVYRQLMYAVLIQSIATAVAGIALSWQKLPRTGAFTAAPPPATAVAATPASAGPPGGDLP